jgi:hypothetical protein
MSRVTLCFFGGISERLFGGISKRLFSMRARRIADRVLSCFFRAFAGA